MPITLVYGLLKLTLHFIVLKNGAHYLRLCLLLIQLRYALKHRNEVLPVWSK